MTTFTHLLEPLTTYTKDKLGFITTEKQEQVNAIYEEICHSMSALHGSNFPMKQGAIQYFRSQEFEKHCRYVGISKNLMLHVVESAPKKIIKNASS
jgi:hypothetical protein